MNEELNFNTVTPLLKDVLDKLMKEPLLDPFILVGGTNLSLRLGHRRSDDIDLFTDAFLSGYETLNGIRMAPMEQIAAMKMHAVYHGGRKKDWWDIHELLNTFSLQELIDLHNNGSHMIPEKPGCCGS